MPEQPPSKERVYSARDFYEQLDILRRQEGLRSWIKFEEACGLKQYVSRWKKGELPSADSLMKIALKFGVSIDWLLLGKKPGEPKIIQPILTIVGENFNIPSGAYSPEEYFCVPMVEGRIAAIYDGPIPHEFVKSLVWVYEKDIGERKFHNLRAVRVGYQAHAMWRIVRTGDIIIIDPLEKPPYQPLSLKGIYAIRHNIKGGYALRRVRESDDHWVFIADNPQYDMIQVKKTARGENPIIGQVVYAWRNFMFDTFTPETELPGEKEEPEPESEE